MDKTIAEPEGDILWDDRVRNLGTDYVYSIPLLLLLKGSSGIEGISIRLRSKAKDVDNKMNKLTT